MERWRSRRALGGHCSATRQKGFRKVKGFRDMDVLIRVLNRKTSDQKKVCCMMRKLERRQFQLRIGQSLSAEDPPSGWRLGRNRCHALRQKSIGNFRFDYRTDRFLFKAATPQCGRSAFRQRGFIAASAEWNGATCGKPFISTLEFAQKRCPMWRD